MEVTSMFKGAYGGKRVLVTGHTGFKGAWLVRWLCRLGAEVTGYSIEPPSSPSMFDVLGLRHDIHHVHGDIRDLEALRACFAEARPEVVFHLAAQPLVRRSYRDPVETYSSNVMGTVHLLECVRGCAEVRAVVNVTSDKCYENREWLWGYRENEPMGGHDPYSSSKGCAELVASAFTRSFFNPDEYGKTHAVALASVRAGNVIGGGDWGEDRLIPDCARALGAGQEVVLRNPGAVRPWQHVMEPLRGYMMLGARLLADGAAFSGGWNFGPSDTEAWTVEETVRLFCELWGEGGFRVESATLHEAGWLKLDSSKSRQLLGWVPRTGTAEAIKRTVAWYKAHADGADCKALCRITDQQIDDAC